MLYIHTICIYYVYNALVSKSVERCVLSRYEKGNNPGLLSIYRFNGTLHSLTSVWKFIVHLIGKHTLEGGPKKTTVVALLNLAETNCREAKEEEGAATEEGEAEAESESDSEERREEQTSVVDVVFVFDFVDGCKSISMCRLIWRIVY